MNSESLVGRSLIRLQELPRRNGVEVTIQQKGDLFPPEDQTELSLHLNVSQRTIQKIWGGMGKWGEL